METKLPPKLLKGHLDGTSTGEPADRDQGLRNVDYLPYPEQLYLEVCMPIFPCKPDDSPRRLGNGAAADCVPTADNHAGQPGGPDYVSPV